MSQDLKNSALDCGVPLRAIDAVTSIVHQHAKSLVATLTLSRFATEGNPMAEIVEIGVGEGGALIAMAYACPAAMITAIDPFIPYTEKGQSTVTTPGFTRQHFEEVLLRYPPEITARINCIQKASDDAHVEIPDGSVDMVFIDGNHTEDYVIRDIENYFPKVRKGGILAGHDYGPWFPGVISGVDKALPDVDLFDDTTVWWMRVK